MLDRNSDVITQAQVYGYFRAKKQEKRDEILAELQLANNFSGSDMGIVKTILDQETEKRQQAYENRVKRQMQLATEKENRPLSGGVDTANHHIQQLPPGKYVLTTAQNNTDVDITALQCLQTFCEYNDATILCAKTTYNLNGWNQPEQGSIYYDPRITKYLVQGQINLGGNIEFIADANVLPTAKHPLSGFAGATEYGISVIIPATKIALECTPALDNAKSKILFATGCITKRNYIMRKAGNVAATMHNIGALFVDTTQTPFVARQLELMPNANCIYDDNRAYWASGHISEENPICLQFGDIHAEKMSDENAKKCISLLQHYKPRHVMLHDVCDFSSRNHHNIKNCQFVFNTNVKQNTVSNDLQLVADFIDAVATYTLDNATVHIIESNHDTAINKWLIETDFKNDPTNAVTYLKCMLAWYEHTQSGNSETFNMLEWCMLNLCMLDKHNIRFHQSNESLVIAGIEHSQHGEHGANGSKGSPKQFANIGLAMNTGHTHTPSIHGKVYTAGVSGELKMGYNEKGMSSWQYAHIVTYANGQRQIIFA